MPKEFTELPDFLLQPPEDKPVAYDWQGEAIYEGEKFYRTEHGYVLEDDLKAYFEGIYGEAKEL